MAEKRLEMPRFQIGRFSDNELVLFDEQRQESQMPGQHRT
jgi:hypothetical protein